MSRGFTLIELLIVLTIVGLLTGGGILYLNRTNAVQKIDSAKQEVLSNLRFARNLAITNQKPNGFGNLGQVRVSLTANGIVTAWPVDTAGSVGTSYFSKDATPDGINTVLSTGTTFSFTPYEGRFLGTGDTLMITISSTEVDSSNNKQLIINQSGLINDQ